ncbi:MAG: MarR family transcriptional regulator [Caldilineaceae bacterium]|jgi:MarR family 2-MHQ and catechol resistance regulon transcriptional repressor|nr:MarR family transcriptional regulator [Caldilineaceae bacterium]
MPTHFAGRADEILALDTLIKLSRAANSLLARIALHNTHPDLTVSQFGTLEALYHLGTMSQSGICDKLLKSGGNTTLVIDNLEKRDLVRRKRDPNDRRVVLVELTDDGLELIRSIFPRHAQVVAEEMSILTPEELRQLGELCKKLGKGRSATVSNSSE